VLKLGGGVARLSFLKGFFHFRLFRCAAVLLGMLGWSVLGFCGPIHDAAQRGDVANAAELLRGDSHLVSSKDDIGDTPLHLAARMGHMNMVELLLAHGASVNVKDNAGITPLHLAALDGHADVVELLLAKKAEIEAKDNDGNTPLDKATQKGDKDIVDLLRQHGGR
jgi:cytohesin